MTFNDLKPIIRIINKYLLYKHFLEMWTLIFSTPIDFEANFENRSPDHAELGTKT